MPEANGPMIAIFLPDLGSGSRSPSFLSRTIDLRPASRDEGDRRLGARARLFALQVDAAERIVEQAERGLDREHLPHRLVEPRLRHFARLDQFGKVFPIEAAGHAHVDAGEEGELRGLARILREAVVDHLHVAGVIGDDEALETPFAAQDIAHQPFVAGGGDARNLVERGHERQHPGIHCGAERREDRFRAACARRCRRCCSRAPPPRRHRPRNAWRRPSSNRSP